MVSYNAGVFFWYTFQPATRASMIGLLTANPFFIPMANAPEEASRLSRTVCPL